MANTLTIVSWVQLVYGILSSGMLLLNRLPHVRGQVLVNSGYHSSQVSTAINNAAATSIFPALQLAETVKLYYRNYKSSKHKTDERFIKDITHKNVSPADRKQNRTLRVRELTAPSFPPRENLEHMYIFKAHFIRHNFSCWMSYNLSTYVGEGFRGPLHFLKPDFGHLNIMFKTSELQ